MSSNHAQTYVNPGSIIAVVVLFPVLAAITVALRIWSRRVKKAGLGIDDYMAIASAAILLGCSIDLLIGRLQHKVGYHDQPGLDFNIPGVEQLNKDELAFNLMWYLGVTLVKLSFLFFYRRIFRGKAFDIVNWTTIALVVCWGVAFFLVTLFTCRQRFDLLWSAVPPFLDPKCEDSVAILFASSLTSCFLDVVVFIIPMPLIWQLNLRRRAKFELMGMFAIGGLCIAASSLRLALYSSLWWAVYSHDKNPTIFGLSAVDDFGIISLGLFWSQVELGVANVACCLPSLKPLLGSETLKNLPSTFSALSLHSIRRAFSAKSSSELNETEKPQRQTSETPSADRATQIHETGKHDNAETATKKYWWSPPVQQGTVQSYSSVEVTGNADPGLIEQGAVTRTVQVEQMTSRTS